MKALERILNWLSILAAVLGTIFVFYSASLSNSVDKQALSLTEQAAEQIDTVSQQQEAISSIIGQVERAVAEAENLSSEAFAISSMRGNLSDLSVRIEAVEETLDIQPRELISVLLLEKEISQMKQEQAQLNEQVIREIDRAYNTVQNFVLTLLAAIILMALGRLVRGKTEP